MLSVLAQLRLTRHYVTWANLAFNCDICSEGMRNSSHLGEATWFVLKLEPVANKCNALDIEWIAIFFAAQVDLGYSLKIAIYRLNSFFYCPIFLVLHCGLDFWRSSRDALLFCVFFCVERSSRMNVIVCSLCCLPLEARVPPTRLRSSRLFDFCCFK